MRHAFGDAQPYSVSEDFSADLAVLADSLTEFGAALLAGGRLRRLIRAVQVFGFHLVPVDLRQNSEAHERTIAELLARAGSTVDIAAYRALPEDARISLLAEELVRAHPLYSPHIEYTLGCVLI